MSTIVAKIDVTKIDKAKLFIGKNGAKYLDIALIEKQDNYGNDYMIVQSSTKEEREAGKRGAILGNGKFLARSAAGNGRTDSKSTANRGQSSTKVQHEKTDNEDEDVPF